MINSAAAISKSDIEAVLSKIRSLSNQTNQLTEKKNVEASTTSGFESIISTVKNSLSSVSKVENQAQAFKASFMQGEPDVSLSQVLVSSARSKIAFEGLITIRKHFIEAYKEIMSLPI